MNSCFNKKNYRNCVVSEPPPPLKLISKFSDGFGWFEFEWVVLRAKNDEGFYPVNQENQEKISDLKKVFRRV